MFLSSFFTPLYFFEKAFSGRGIRRIRIEADKIAEGFFCFCAVVQILVVEKTQPEHGGTLFIRGRKSDIDAAFEVSDGSGVVFAKPYILMFGEQMERSEEFSRALECGYKFLQIVEPVRTDSCVA